MANTKKVTRQAEKYSSSSADIIPIIDINQYDAFVDAEGKIIDMFQISCKDIMAAKEHDVIFDMTSWTMLYKSYEHDLKIITMNYPVDSKEQVAYVEKIIERTENPLFIKELEQEKQILEHTNEKYLAEEYYLMYFSKDEENYRRNKSAIKGRLSNSDQVKEMTLGKKIQILNKTMNMNSSLSTLEETKKIPRGLTAGNRYNGYLLSAIQPKGGVSCKDERYVKKGDGYEACIHVYEFPPRAGFAWISGFTKYENTITAVDIGATDKRKVSDKISSSLDEQISRYIDARHTIEKYDAQKVYRQLEELNALIEEAGEVIKRVHIRIFVFDRQLAELEKRVEDIIEDIESKKYRAAIMLGESDEEWKSLLMSISEQDYLRNSREGVSIPSETLALGHPYHFSALADPYGTYWGFTKTGGTVFYNPFHKDKYRLSYCSIVTGRMGSGKSTFLKLSMKKRIIQGHYIRGFATNKEFNELIRKFGGSVLSLDGSEGMINVLHVYKTSENETLSFMNHLDRVSKWYRLLVPEATSHDRMELEEAVRELYKEHMGYDYEAEQKSDKHTTITGRPPKEYPILEDLYNYLQHKIYSDIANKKKRENITESRFIIFEKIERTLSNAIKSFGRLFNGHSSIRAFEKEQIVFFNVAGILKLNSNIFDAQMYSAYFLLWENMIQIGEPQKELYDKGELQDHDKRHYSIFMDEAHNFVNSSKLDALNMLDSYVRESRKYFADLILATQQVSDFYPQGSSGEGLNAMNNLFSLAQYRMFFQQPSDSTELIRNCVGDEIPGKDLEDLNNFVQGECLMNISGVSSIRYHVEVTEDELELFAGGA